ncbi:MAG: chemotaxis protein CheR [Gammaproteobacteria bacterium HGW-Gammaproteobacteria-4]|jgi:chemotaxis protein methyltransferase CheR|nr:MAG: chemotaxis protein CheR [Gammaproteobacteria bacterium HGW-Gammaproteobacteria-4]
MRSSADMMPPGDEAGGDPSIALRDEDFSFISAFVFERCGIVLGANKRQLVYGRLMRRLRELGLVSFAQYVARLREQPDAELDSLASAISTNVTSFFRENHHFEFLAQDMLPALAGQPNPRIRIWSAGCSSGEEPYSIAMVLAEVLGNRAPSIARVLATDLSVRALGVGKQGTYPLDRLQGISEQRRKRWFLSGRGGNEGQAMIVQEVRDLIAFKQLNLLHDWPIKGPLDAIFCRNVVIYFDNPTKQRLFARYAQLLAPGGYLFLGHSESLHGMSDAFDLVGRTIYRKRA